METLDNNKTQRKELDVFVNAIGSEIEQAQVKTDKRLGYRPLKSEFSNLIQLSSGEKGGNFPEIHRAIMLFKSWLRGIHHRVTDLQAYIDEYTYRFNRHFMNASIFDNLILRMIKANACVIFKSEDKSTAAHEILHMLDLAHTFTAQQATNLKSEFTYKALNTNNVMDYSHWLEIEKYSLFHWQWKIINTNLKI